MSGAPLPPLSPTLSALQRRTSIAYAAQVPAPPPVPRNCFVTGGTGFVGQRLVEMLVERGAARVVSYDIVPRPADAWTHPAIEWVVGDIADVGRLTEAMRGAECVWHLAAAVGPFHPRVLYDTVNHVGSLNVIKACAANGVTKCVFSSSPSTRFTGEDLDGVTEADLPPLPLPRYLQAYAETKALGELALTRACSASFMTIAVAPHQVYGPKDNLFLPNIMEAAGTGKLRVVGARRRTRAPCTPRAADTRANTFTHARANAYTRVYTCTDTRHTPRARTTVRVAVDSHSGARSSGRARPACAGRTWTTTRTRSSSRSGRCAPGTRRSAASTS
jgi:nucleoside-diphosphate-sugar epimerase